jgi:hypothetical protein
VGAFLLAIIVVPLWFAKRPLKAGETREGGTAWNVLKFFALSWTALMAIGAAVGFVNAAGLFASFDSDAARAGGALGMVLDMGFLAMIWFIPTVGALVLGFFLKKASVIEHGPTGPLVGTEDVATAKNSSSVGLVGIGVVALLVVGGLLVVGVPAGYAPSLFGSRSSSSLATLPSSLDPSTPASNQTPWRVTRRNFNGLRPGMPYEGATALLGPGTETARTEFGDCTTVMYRWTSEDGGNVSAMFHNDELIERAQVGL